MRSLEIKGWQKDAALKAIVMATWPDYRRKVVYIEATPTVTLHDLNWGGGTRYEYRTCSLTGELQGTTATDQAKVDALHEDFVQALDKGDEDRAMKDLEQAAEIVSRDPEVNVGGSDE